MEVKKVNWFLPIFIIGYVALSVVASLVFGALLQQGIRVPLWVSLVLGEVILLAIALLYILIMKISIKRDMTFKKLKPMDMLLSLLTGYMLIPMVLFIGNLTMLFSTNHLEQSTQGLTDYPFIVQVILMAVIPPLVEEFVFRGLFFGAYKKSGLLGAVIMSGLVFGFFHLNINQFCYAFVIGLVFAVMVEATGSIWSSVLAHFAINTYSIGILEIVKLLGQNEMLEQASESGLSAYPWYVIIFEMCMLLGMSIGFLSLVFLAIKSMAQRNGRWEMLCANLKERHGKGSGVHFATVPAIFTFILCVAYMIFIEIA